ncbi:hypothetical protein INR49_027650 [Caranx melampygus]|nr:hypothetical protein INR49_027650 [Caranx melampygus]
MQEEGETQPLDEQLRVEPLILNQSDRDTVLASRARGTPREHLRDYVSRFFRKDQGDFFIGCLFLTELSTPFVSLGKILIQLSLQDCWLHKANGGMVLFTFFMCRIALFPYMYWMYGQHYGIPLYSVPFHLPLSTNLGNSCILAPQVYWFILLCRKGYRLYKRSRSPHASPAAAVTDNSKDD